MKEFPFVAMVGQDQLKVALLLNAIDPKIGGVLIRGDKGSGKSTLARGLAELLPQGSPFIEIPAGVTEDRVKGSVDLEKMLTDGSFSSNGGLLAAANGGVLYVDEVNLLPDHIVDLLLDAAASGINRLERDGVSAIYQARFVLVGSMNPEEGELRPQFLDRFGLSVKSSGIDSPNLRKIALERRLRFDADPEGFCLEYSEDQMQIIKRLEDLHRRNIDQSLYLLSAQLSDQMMQMISELCISYQVEGLRADLTLARAAAAYAALMGRDQVEENDIWDVAPLVMAHRARKDPFQGVDEPGDRSSSGREQQGISQSRDPMPKDSTASSNGETEGKNDADFGSQLDKQVGDDRQGSSGELHGSSITFGNSVISVLKSIQRTPAILDYSPRVGGGGRGSTPIGYSRNVKVEDHGPGVGIDMVSTVTAAAVRSASEGRDPNQPYIVAEDLAYGRKISKQGRTVLVALDLSGSVGMDFRIDIASSVIESILLEAYQSRDQVGVIVIAQGNASLLQRATRSVEIIRSKLSVLTTGGVTPLGKGINLLIEQSLQLRKIGEHPYSVLITDGRATGNPSAYQETISAAGKFRAAHLDGCVIDIENSQILLGLTSNIAEEMGARLISGAALLDNLDPGVIRSSVFGSFQP